jgi:hypothetical protein
MFSASAACARRWAQLLPRFVDANLYAYLADGNAEEL